MAKRRPKQPDTGPAKGDDDWLSPLISSATAAVGGALGGPIGGLIGSRIGKAGGKVAAEAAGMEETGLTRGLQAASEIGTDLAGVSGLLPGSAADDAAAAAASQAPAIPAAAQPGVAIGQDMVAQRVAADGLAQSPMVRSPMAQQIYEAGAYVPPSMAVSQVPEGMKGRAGDLFEPAGSLGFVPERGTLYEATPEAARRRNQERIFGNFAKIDQSFMPTPGYADAKSLIEDENALRNLDRQLQEQKLRGEAAQRELEGMFRR